MTDSLLIKDFNERQWLEVLIADRPLLVLDETSDPQKSKHGTLKMF